MTLKGIESETLRSSTLPHLRSIPPDQPKWVSLWNIWNLKLWDEVDENVQCHNNISLCRFLSQSMEMDKFTTIYLSIVVDWDRKWHNDILLWHETFSSTSSHNFRFQICYISPKTYFGQNIASVAPHENMVRWNKSSSGMLKCNVAKTSSFLSSLQSQGGGPLIHR